MSLGAFGAFAGLLFLARLGLALPGSGWISFALMVVLALGYQMTFVVIGGQAGRLFDVRQMKRLFPLVLTGLVVGFMAGGLMLPLLTRLLGATDNLLFAAAAAMAIALALLGGTIRRFRQLARAPDAPAAKAPAGAAPRPAAAKSLPQLVRRRYVALIFGYQMLSAVGTQLVLFLFLDQAELNYPAVEDLAGFFGHFTIVLNLLTIVFLARPAGAILGRFGLGVGLAANPVVVAALVLAMVAAGAAGAPAVALFFWLAVAGRIFDIMLSVGTTSPSIKATYQALPAAERPIVETAVEGIGVPIAFGIAGVILLVFEAIPGLTLIHTLLFTAAVTALWTAAGFLVYRGYRGALSGTVSRRALGEAELSLADASSLEVVENLLASGRASDARLALDVLEQAEHPSLDARLLGLLDHGDAEIRAEALTRLERRSPAAALAAVGDRLETESDPAVRGAAVRAFCALAEADAVERATPYLDDAAPEVRLGALVGLLRYGGIAGVLAAGERLAARGRSADPADRSLAARAIGEVATRSFYQPLEPLLADGEAAVRRAALLAAGRVGHPRLLPAVIANLAATATRSAAIEALCACGETVLPHLEQGLGDDGPYGEEDVIRLVRAAGVIRGERVAALLKRHLDHPDDDVQVQVLATLDFCGFRADDPADRAEVERTLGGEVEHGLRILLTRRELGDEGEERKRPFRHLHRSLDHELDQARRRSFLLLSFLYEARAVLRAEEQLVRGSGPQQALAFEMLDVTLAAEHKALLLPLVDPKMDLGERARRLGQRLDVPGLDREARLEQIIADPEGLWTHGWTRAAAIHAAAEMDLAGLAAAVEGALEIAEPPVRETAAWALRRLDPARFERHVGKLLEDEDPQVRRVAASSA